MNMIYTTTILFSHDYCCNTMNINCTTNTPVRSLYSCWGPKGWNSFGTIQLHSRRNEKWRVTDANDLWNVWFSFRLYRHAASRVSHHIFIQWMCRRISRSGCLLFCWLQRRYVCTTRMDVFRSTEHFTCHDDVQINKCVHTTMYTYRSEKVTVKECVMGLYLCFCSSTYICVVACMYPVMCNYCLNFTIPCGFSYSPTRTSTHPRRPQHAAKGRSSTPINCYWTNNQ